MRRPAFLGAVLLAGLVVVPVPGTTAGAAQAPAGEIVDFAILPPSLTVQAGDTITWTNGGQRPHTVTDRGGMFDTDPILPGEQAAVTVTVPGTYEVFCRINPSRMNARVIVEPGPEPPSAVRIEALDESREGETLRFEPAELEVALGAQVILANVGGLPHSLRTDDGSFRIPVVEPGSEQGRFAGGNAAVTVTKPGTYGFFCDIHPDVMRGTLVVTDTRVAAEPEERAPPATESPPTSRPPPAADVQATIAEYAFDPTETAVVPGSTVTWQNTGDEAHTVTFDDLEIDLGPVEPGETASATAPEDAGTYSYYCAIHPEDMRGALLVRVPAVAVAASSAPDEPADGTVFAYALGALFLGTGLAGLGLWHRHR